MLTNSIFPGGVSSNLSSKADLDSPNFTGVPTSPTAVPGSNNNQVANTSFVRGEIESILNGAPAALDTLNELAGALNNDEDFAATITAQLGLKANASDLGTAAAQDIGYFATAAQGAAAAAAMPKAGGIFGGTVTVRGVSETVKAITGTNNPILSASDGTVFTFTTTANTNVYVAGGFSHGFTFIITMGGAHTITWSSAFDWGAAGAPEVPASGEKLVVSGFTPDGGSTYHVAKVWASA